MIYLYQIDILEKLKNMILIYLKIDGFIC